MCFGNCNQTDDFIFNGIKLPIKCENKILGELMLKRMILNLNQISRICVKK